MTICSTGMRTTMVVGLGYMLSGNVHVSQFDVSFNVFCPLVGDFERGFNLLDIFSCFTLWCKLNIWLLSYVNESVESNYLITLLGLIF